MTKRERKQVNGRRNGTATRYKAGVWLVCPPPVHLKTSDPREIAAASTRVAANAKAFVGKDGMRYVCRGRG